MRRSATGQLALVFADNPCPEASGNGSGGAAASDASGAKAWLLQQANGKEASGADARATEPLDTARLLERAASVGNLSRALLNVARNKGAPGVDGRSVEEVVGNARRLVVNRDKSRVDRPERLHLLGFTLRRNKVGGVDVHLSARSKTRLAQRIRELTPRRWGGSFASCVDRLNRYLRGWYGYFRLCSGQGAANFEAIDGHVRRRLRMLIIRQKGRRPRFLFRHLCQHDVAARSAARTAFGRRGIWFQSATYAMHKAHGNAWFARRVFTLVSQWNNGSTTTPIQHGPAANSSNCSPHEIIT